MKTATDGDCARDLAANIREVRHGGREPLAQALAAAVADDLRAGIAQRGVASLAVSGGSTPRLFFDHLAQEDLDWSRVVVTLVDERWVPETDARSNAAMARKALLSNGSGRARFVPLYDDAPDPESALDVVDARLDDVPLPFDAVVLGMGLDGHTASFFPHGDRLAAALDPRGEARVISMRAEAAGEPRITLTLPTLLATQALYLHIEGDTKAQVLAQALAADATAEEFPIRAVVRYAGEPVRLYWCP
ncbi:6-phosphogluconolactonase [Tahibacter soli]|jgi:6-phosphogluconolactonase|uniref:6-phosphogluconolactonase n=1 Tax=Tahibacter soli TaxID=2983605 RepID=A0A9X3YFK7_9GAMM|nr:6-phosphogluconolactonase [Tahibacter soli]MDC8010927.1 6-phosphogluconolactonase [Tahibacter soli]